MAVQRRVRFTSANVSAWTIVWLQVLNLLLDMPDGFAEVLMEYGALPRILQVVELQLVRQAFSDRRVIPPNVLVLVRHAFESLTQ